MGKTRLGSSLATWLPAHWGEWVVVVIVVAVAEWVGLLQPLRSVTELAVRPLQQAGVGVVQTLSWPLVVVQSAHRGAQRIQELEQRYAEVAAQVSRLSAVEAENQALREQLQAGPAPQTRTVLAAPIVSLASPAVAAGSESGVNEGQIVLVQQTLIGTIGRVTPRQAEVRLLSQAGALPVLAQTESGVQGIVRGKQERLFLEEVPLDAVVTVGQRIVAVGQSGIDRDLLIGRVQRVDVHPNLTTQVIYIDQVVSFYQARVVEIR